jgi:glutaminase
MTKLSMYESLPFDEATAPSLVSTGELPQIDQVRDAVTEAYERYRSNGDGMVADYIPALASASPRLFGICVVGARGRFFEIGDVGRRSRSKASPSHSSSRWSATPSVTRRRDIGWASTARIPVQLADGCGVE